MTSTPVRSLGNSARGYTNEQRSLRAKLDQILKWTKDLKSSVMKQSCKVLQPNQENRRATIDQIHDDLDDYKRKLDRELGLIHDICDALTVDESFVNGDEENLNDEILEALRRSPTYSSLEQHMFDDKRPKIRLKPRERIHPFKRRIGVAVNSGKRPRWQWRWNHRDQWRRKSESSGFFNEKSYLDNVRNSNNSGKFSVVEQSVSNWYRWSNDSFNVSWNAQFTNKFG